MIEPDENSSSVLERLWSFHLVEQGQKSVPVRTLEVLSASLNGNGVVEQDHGDQVEVDFAHRGDHRLFQAEHIL